jgi:hypothetical protein
VYIPEVELATLLEPAHQVSGNLVA